MAAASYVAQPLMLRDEDLLWHLGDTRRYDAQNNRWYLNPNPQRAAHYQAALNPTASTLTNVVGSERCAARKECRDYEPWILVKNDPLTGPPPARNAWAPNYNIPQRLNRQPRRSEKPTRVAQKARHGAAALAYAATLVPATPAAPALPNPPPNPAPPVVVTQAAPIVPNPPVVVAQAIPAHSVQPADPESSFGSPRYPNRLFDDPDAPSDPELSEMENPKSDWWP